MWEISRERLLPALELLNLVPEKLGMTSSEFLWIRGKGSKVRLSAASYIDGEITLDGKGAWPLKKDFFVDRRTFLPFVFASKELKNRHSFQFETHKRQLRVRHGDRKSDFDSQKGVSGYGDLRKVHAKDYSKIPLSDDLKELLKCGRSCATTDATMPELNCVYVSRNGRSVAVETYSASDKIFYVGKGELGAKVGSSIPFPLLLISMLDTAGLKSVEWHGKYVVLRFKHGKLWQPISQEAFKKFPLDRIKSHVKKTDSHPISFTISGRRFSVCMLRFTYYLQRSNRRDWVVRIEGKRGAGYIRVSTSLPGFSPTEKLRVLEPLVEDFSLEWPLDALEPTFSLLAQKAKKQGLIVRVDSKHSVSYLQAGKYWLAVPSRRME